jgi:hypothetical protein
MLFQVYDISHTLCQRVQAKKCKVRKVRGSQNGDFIDIKNDLVVKPKSASYKPLGTHHKLRHTHLH